MKFRTFQWESWDFMGKLGSFSNFVETFDLIILNGVLEWVATSEDVNLDREWYKKRKKLVKNTKPPDEIQINVLKEIKRIMSL